MSEELDKLTKEIEDLKKKTVIADIADNEIDTDEDEDEKSNGFIGSIKSGKLSLKQKLNLLSQIAKDPEINELYRIRAIQVHSELAGDKNDAPKRWTLNIVVSSKFKDQIENK